jgi:hypothetical protein
MPQGSAPLTPYNEGWLDGAMAVSSRHAAAVKAIFDSTAWKIIAQHLSLRDSEVQALSEALRALAEPVNDPRGTP